MKLDDLLWTLRVGVVSSVTAALVGRLLDRTYRKVTKHDPPEMPTWAKVITGTATKPIAHAVQP